MSQHKIEISSFGKIKALEYKLLGAHTQRVLLTLKISNKIKSKKLIRALGEIKLCSAKISMYFRILDIIIGNTVVKLANEIAGCNLKSIFR